MGATPQLSVSVVTHNSARCLPRFLESLERQKGVTWEARFFDNASADETRLLVERSGLGSMTASAVNLGFGRGHNQNVSGLAAPSLLLLNPDITFGPDLFVSLLGVLESGREYGLVGPRILEGPGHRPFLPRRFYPGEGMVALEPSLARTEIAWLSGCCLLIRRELFDALGGFDPAFFLYQEDTDLCLRARRAGRRIGQAGVVVHHLHRQSQREQSEYEYACRVFTSSALFWEKHYGPREVVGMVRFQYWVAGLLLNAGWLRRRLPSLAPALDEPRLRARRDTCREWLVRRGLGATGAAGAGRIGLRQARIALEWIRRGRFPLDDY